MVERLPAMWRRPFLFESELSRLMGDFFGDFADLGFDFAPRYGRTDIYEKNRNLVFETELPGTKKEDIDINVEQGRLVISGETKRSDEVKEENYFRVGRQYGRFQRSFPLPQESIDAKGIKAAFKNGILKVTVPLEESIKEKEKTIEIKVE
jgi:HSP20 family protein